MDYTCLSINRTCSFLEEAECVCFAVATARTVFTLTNLPTLLQHHPTLQNDSGCAMHPIRDAMPMIDEEMSIAVIFVEATVKQLLLI